MTIFLGSTTCFFSAKFMLTVSHNHGNQSYIMYGDKIHEKLELCLESKC